MFLDGMLLGLAYAMPIGSQNLFLIQAALRTGLPRSYLYAMVVASCDLLLGLACFFGVGALVLKAPASALWLQVIGGSYLVYIGVAAVWKARVWTANKPLANPEATSASILRSLFLLTWLNPHAWIDGTAILGGARASIASKDTVSFALGLGVASFLWFIGLATAVGSARAFLPVQFVRWLNILGGIGLAIFGIALLVKCR